MKVSIEKATSTTEQENQYLIALVNSKIAGFTRIEEAYEEVKRIIRPIIKFECGRGGNHIWVSNWKNERLMLITETRYNK